MYGIHYEDGLPYKRSSKRICSECGAFMDVDPDEEMWVCDECGNKEEFFEEYDDPMDQGPI